MVVVAGVDCPRGFENVKDDDGRPGDAKLKPEVVLGLVDVAKVDAGGLVVLSVGAAACGCKTGPPAAADAGVFCSAAAELSTAESDTAQHGLQFQHKQKKTTQVARAVKNHPADSKYLSAVPQMPVSRQAWSDTACWL